MAINAREIMEETGRNADQLIAILVKRLSLDPLVIGLTSFAGWGFHRVHEGVAGLTVSAYAFNRDVPHSGNSALWGVSPTRGSVTDIRMRFSGRDGRVPLSQASLRSAPFGINSGVDDASPAGQPNSASPWPRFA